jgi:hypothetical protein
VAECSAPLLKRNGFLLVTDPDPGDLKPTAAANERWPAAGLARLGMVLEDVCIEPAFASVIRSTRRCTHQFPRSKRLKDRLF